jgi:hypothetical protein
VTGQALMAVNSKPFPLAPVPREASHAVRAKANPLPGARDGGTAPGDPARSKTDAKPAAPAPADAAPTETNRVPLAPASSTEGGDDGGISPGLIVILAAAGLAAGVWGGWLLYRRRLP